MNSASNSLNVTIPLALTAHTRAQQLRQQQPNATKAKQVYLNTLAVYAVKLYLEWREFETDWKNSDSYHPEMLSLMDVADLVIPHYGKLECRPVLPHSEVMQIPEEVWADRIAYVAVRLHESLREATLLGFVETVHQKEVPLTELRSLDRLPAYIHQFQPKSDPKFVQLSRWLDRSIEIGWETLDRLFKNSPPQLAFNFRRQTESETKRGKLLKLEQAGEEVILLVSLTQVEESELDISVELFPADCSKELPQNLQLSVLDEMGKTVMQAEAGSSESLEFQFSGTLGEKFSIKVILAEVSITEFFTI